MRSALPFGRLGGFVFRRLHAPFDGGVDGSLCEAPRLDPVLDEPGAFAGRIEPGLVFDRDATLDEVPAGYRAMDDREAVKVMIRF